jgi:hypothetical protein
MNGRHSGPWEVLRRQVALCGRVTSALSGIAVDDADVRTREDAQVRSRIAERRAGGVYFFLDLPAGRYEVEGEDASGRSRGMKAADVSWDDTGTVRRAVVDLELKPKDGQVAPAHAAVAQGRLRRKPRNQ